MTVDTLRVELMINEFAVIVLPYKFVAFKRLKEIEDAVTDVPTAVLEATLLPAMVENKTVPPTIEEPTSDEIIRVLPLRVEKTSDVKPLRVDTNDVDVVIVLPLSVDTFKLFAFMVDTIELDTVTMLPVMVE